MRALTPDLRKQLEAAVLAARRAAEDACRAALDGLGVFQREKPPHLDLDKASLRNGLRAKWRQFGEDRDLLISECAYEQWHRLLFARFLAETHLLLHPQYKAPVTLVDCEEIAVELGEPDGWSVAARFAAEILPGIFRLDDPGVRLRLAPEGRHALEEILGGLPRTVFVADDALGWVYQFWQKDKKDEVNSSERKIDGPDLGPITQIFTDNYMVRFLLENSLGAWWASRHGTSSLIEGFDYFHLQVETQPDPRAFARWPECVAQVTVMDPCCGSGHFLVEAFSMLWRMRVEEEGLSPVAAQDAVLRDNLFGLELDPRCVQIAMFAVALQAWKAGGGWRELPVPHIACSGIPVKTPAKEWTALASGDKRLEQALSRLHTLFQEADTLGSLIDPKRSLSRESARHPQRSLEDVNWEEIIPLLQTALDKESIDPAGAVLGEYASGVARAANYLARRYTLVATNVPWVQRNRQGAVLTEYCDRVHPATKSDLAFAFAERASRMVVVGGTYALITPQQWTTLTSYTSFRQSMLERQSLELVAPLGATAFTTPMHPGIKTGLSVVSNAAPPPSFSTTFWDVQHLRNAAEKGAALAHGAPTRALQSAQLDNPDCRILARPLEGARLLSQVANSFAGVQTGDSSRFIRRFWEIPEVSDGWELMQTKVNQTIPFGGRNSILLWENGNGSLYRFVRDRLGEKQVAAWIRGHDAWGKAGIAVGQMWELRVTLYTGELFDNNTAVIIPNDPRLQPAVWAFCASDEFHSAVREIDQKLGVTNKTLAKVPFDAERWRRTAEEAGPLPAPVSDDPTQWLFRGRPDTSTEPLQVAVARLLGYRWPEQPDTDDLDSLADEDGIVCLPPVAGEAAAVERLQRILAAALRTNWAPGTETKLLGHAGSRKKSLADWLKDEFFKQHSVLFENRPFIWHIWDGTRDGFSALVNYHRLDRRLLEKLTYSYLGQDWVERQRGAIRDDVAGAEARLSAALDLQRRLEGILEGEKPYDIYVRWKKISEQPIGWTPDLNDGVRLNIRPFVEAGVLRSPFNIHWRKDRGANPDGSERENDTHLSLDDKRAARTHAD